MKTFLAIVALIAVTTAFAHESEHVPPPATVGLLRLPSVFGNGACDRFREKPVVLFSAPRKVSRVGQISVTQPWRFDKEGGCSGLEVGVKLRGTDSAETLPTLEYGYESPAAIVVARAGSWCRVLLHSGTAWIHEECEPGFIPLEELLSNRSLYLLEGAIERARKQPGGAEPDTYTTLRRADQLFAHLLSKMINGEVWLHLATTQVNDCEREPKPSEVARLWIPLRDDIGRPLVWFHPRGC